MDGTPAHRLIDALDRATGHAPYLRRLIQREPDIVDLLRAGDLPGALASASDQAGPEDDAGRALRREKRRLGLVVAIGDLAGLLTLEQVTAALSNFADRALDRAIIQAIRERTPNADPRGFVAVALGKHGSRELNYSSDIDPILLFDPETLPHRAGEEPAESAVRVARRVVELLQTIDGDGYVFRVDLRLRPSPEATPLALPIPAAIAYYESSALPWERAAFIRARAAGGDRALGKAFLASIQPFIWRRALDFGAIGEIRAMSQRIRSHHHAGQSFGLGYDLKRGWGGIREVEFYAQIHQLIHGGRDPAIRAPATVAALAVLGEAGWIPSTDAMMLSDAYRLYRTIEHRLQMVEDRQTHSLPKEPHSLDAIAQLHGLSDGAALLDLLRPHVTQVGTLYDGLDSAGEDALPLDREDLVAALDATGFAPADRAADRIVSWREGGARALRSAPAQTALEAVLPGLVAALGQAPDPMTALNRFDDVVRSMPSAINLFRLLEAQPTLARLLGDVLCLAPTLADMLGTRPVLIDGLIDASALDPAPNLDALKAIFAKRPPGEDYQGLLDRVRVEVGERRFAQGVQIISGARDPLDVAEGYSRIAEAALGVLASATIGEFETAHGEVRGGELLVLALGRFGGGALTHASDLDIVYLFTGDFQAESKGMKPLGATHYFNRLAQRVTGALSAPTAAGPLYEVDTRLRPSGAQGLLAISLDSFARYQRESAWTWEHMALARARPVFGSAKARSALQVIIDETLVRPRDVARLLHDAVKMRGDIARHKPPAGPFDVKLMPGGLVDLEFLVHVTQLRTLRGFDPSLRDAIAALGGAGMLPNGIAAAHDLLTRVLVTLRLVSPGSEEPSVAAQAAVARACALADWPAVVAALDVARQSVSSAWAAIVAEAGDEE